MGSGTGMQPQTKGVGGYRPTINWRQMAVRRRSVAARQVLACIIVSGVLIMVGGVILTVLGFLVISSKCPFMWRQGAGVCYYLAPHNASWEEGHSYCTSQSASLLHLHSEDEATFITGVMAGKSWLGARRKRGLEGSWAWVDSETAPNYTGWSEGAPTDPEKDLCAAVEPSGVWVAEKCDGKDMAYVICDFVPGYNPFVLVGPVVAACGVVVLVLSVEVCMRRREFINKNPEAQEDDQEEERQVDPGIINYGYGNFGGEEETREEESLPENAQKPLPSLRTENPSLQRIQQVVVAPGSVNVKEEEEEEDEEEEEEEKEEEEEGEEKTKEKEAIKKDKERDGDESSGLKVQVVPASPSSLSPPSIEENSTSQENLELLLSPKTLE